MATYYLKSTGADIAPYDTEENAATSMWSIRALEGFAITDTIILCDDVEDTTFEVAYYTFICNITAKEGLTIRPKYHYNVGMNGPLFGGNVDQIGHVISFSNIHIETTNAAAASFNDIQGNLNITNCILTQNSDRQLIMVLGDSTIVNCLLLFKPPETSNNPFVSFNSIDKKLTMNKCTIICMTAMKSAAFTENNVSEYTNNIFYYPNRTESFASITGATRIENNLYFYSNNDAPLSTISEINTIFANPLFAEAVTYTLSQSSPAIGMGIGGINIGWDQVTQPATQTSGAGITSNSFAYFYPNWTSRFV